MNDIKSIMAACDFSEYASQVVSCAVNLSRKLDAELLVVNIINQRDVYTMQRIEAEHPAFSVVEYLEKQKKDRLEMMEDIIAEVGGDTRRIQKIIRVGVPFKELLQVVEEKKIDMLVMGTKGRGNIAGTLFGSTAEKVFRRCPVPLLSVRPEK